MKNKYQIIEVIGEGAFGIVYKCKNKKTDELVAIKKFKEEYNKLPKKEINREIFALQISNHENIVKLNEAFLNKGYIYLSFEYCEKNLLQLIQENPKGLNPELIRSFIYQMCKAVSYLHKKNIIHRDIKPENLLIKDNSQIKLCDFGFSRKIKYNEKTNNYGKMTDYITTIWYRAPELLLSQGEYGPEIDFWSIGCIMGEMADGNPMFPGDDEIGQLEYIINLIGNLPEELIKLYNENPNFKNNKLFTVDKAETLEKRYKNILTPDAIDFMKGLLELDPKKRLNSDSIFNHKYFSCFKKNKENEINTNNKLFYSLNINQKKNKIPNLNNNSKENDSNIINIYKYDDESFISETNESTLSKRKIMKDFESNSNLQNSSKKQNLKKPRRSDMIDFGELYINEKNINKNEEKNESFNNKKKEDSQIKNQYISELNKLKSINKESLSIKKGENSESIENFPHLSPKFLSENKLSGKSIQKNELKKFNKVSLFQSLKFAKKQIPLYNHITQLKKIFFLPKYNNNKSQLKYKKKYNLSIDNNHYINTLNNQYLKHEKGNSYDNYKNENKIINENQKSTNKIINLYENTFKDIISNPNEIKDFSPNKDKSSKKEVFKKIEKIYLSNNNSNKKKVHLPPIFILSNDIINNNKSYRDNKDFFQNNYKIINNRYNY